MEIDDGILIAYVSESDQIENKSNPPKVLENKITGSIHTFSLLKLRVMATGAQDFFKKEELYRWFNKIYVGSEKGGNSF